jgi:hypothetical protein
MADPGIGLHVFHLHCRDRRARLEPFQHGVGQRHAATVRDQGGTGLAYRGVAGAGLAGFAATRIRRVGPAGRARTGLALPALALARLPAVRGCLGAVARRAGDGCPFAACTGRARHHRGWQPRRFAAGAHRRQSLYLAGGARDAGWTTTGSAWSHHCVLVRRCAAVAAVYPLAPGVSMACAR